MTTETQALTTISAELLERVVVGGDLSRLTPPQRLEWYRHRCEAAGLDVRTQPLQYLVLQNKLVLYATKATTDQLIANRKLTVELIDRRTEGDVYEVTARVTRPDGTTVEDVGCVALGNLRGDALCNARMKAITKAKRRAVLSACGLGVLDETETETIRGAQRLPLEQAHALVVEPQRHALPPAEPEPVVVRDPPAEHAQGTPAEPRRGLLEVMRADLQTCATSAQVKAVYQRAESAIDASAKPPHVKATLLTKAGRLAADREEALRLGKVGAAVQAASPPRADRPAGGGDGD